MIRPMKAEDAEAIAYICGVSLGHECDPSLVAERIDELALDGHYYVMVNEDDEDHQVKGFIQAERYNLLYGGNGWNIVGLAVIPGSQGQGYGGQLMASLEEYSRQWGDTFIRMNSRVEREQTHRFYESRGYVCDKMQKRFIKYL